MNTDNDKAEKLHGESIGTSLMEGDGYLRVDEKLLEGNTHPYLEVNPDIVSTPKPLSTLRWIRNILFGRNILFNLASIVFAL